MSFGGHILSAGPAGPVGCRSAIIVLLIVILAIGLFVVGVFLLMREMGVLYPTRLVSYVQDWRTALS
jgi:hypothetical protein